MNDSIRACGPCTACCTVIAVHELEKGTYEPCQHLCEAGCGIYAERPASCRTFQCQWLRGVLEVDETVDFGMRPDACGVIFDYQPDTSFGEVFTAWEVEPGASRSGQPRSTIDGLAENFLVMIVTRDPDVEKGTAERRFMGPRHLVTRASDLMWGGRAPPASLS